MDKIAKALHTFSLLIFIVYLLYSYAGLPDPVGYDFDANGLPLSTLSKTVYFYSALGIFILFNLIFLVLGRGIEANVFKSLKQYIGVDYTFKKNLISWIYSFGGILNFFLAIILFFFSLLNTTESFDINYFTWLIYVGPILFTVWIVMLFSIFFKKVKSMTV